MKKSNIVLLSVFIAMFGLLGSTRIILEDKFRKKQVRVVTTFERKEQAGSAGKVSFEGREFHHIVVDGDSRIDLLTIKDSSENLIDYEANRHEKVNDSEQFRVVNDTLYFDGNNVSSANIYQDNVKSITIVNRVWTCPVNIVHVKRDSLLLFAILGPEVELSDCSIKYFGTRIGDASVRCRNSKIDTIDFSIGDLGTLKLNDFQGHVKHAIMSNDATLELSGSSVESFEGVKWKK